MPLREANDAAGHSPTIHTSELNSEEEACWQPAKVGHFETREIRDRERAW